MRFTIAQKELALALNAASRAVPNRTTLPALSGILLEARDGQVTFHATDLEMGITCTVPAEAITPGSILLPARSLVEIARRIPEETVDVEVDPVGATATLRWPGSEFVIHGQPAEHFPGLPQPDDAAVTILGRGDLRTVIEGTLFAASQDEARPILTGIQLTIHAGELRALSTDGFRIALRRVPLSDHTADGALNAVLPARTLSELQRFLTGDGEVRLLATPHHVLFETDNVRFLSRVLDAAYPAVMDLIPKSFRARIRTDRTMMHDACERVSLLADPLQKAYATTLSWSDGRAVLSASSPALGRAREELPAAVEGEAMDVIFNARFLAEGLRSCSGSEVVLELSGPLTAARLTSPQDDGFLYVLMPMRPSEN